MRTDGARVISGLVGRRAAAWTTFALGLAILTAPAAAAAAWTPPTSVSPAGLDVANAAAATTSTGATVLALVAGGGLSRGPLDLAVLAPGATDPGPAIELSAGDVFAPQVVTDGHGDAYVSWLQQDLPVPSVVERLADGSLQTDLGLPPDATWPVVAVDATGDAAAVWESTAGGDARLEVALKPAGRTTFAAPIDIAGPIAPTSPTLYPELAVDPDGSAVVAWLAPGSATGATQLATAVVSPGGAVTSGTSTDGQSNVENLQLLQTDAGVLASWMESPVGQSAGSLRAAVDPDSGSFGPAFDIGTGLDGTYGAEFGGPVFATAPGGHVLVAWTTYHPNPVYPGAASGGPVVTAEGQIGTGRFTTPAQLFDAGTSALMYPTGAALAGDGSAVVALADGVVAERDANGAFSLAQATCSGDTKPLVVGLRSGEPSLLWREPSSVADTRQVFLSTTTAAAAPLVCPSHPQPAVVTPSLPVTGQPVTIDATGLANTQLAGNQWAWEVDGDGTQLSPYGDDPVDAVTFAAPGLHYVYIMRRVVDARGNPSYDGTTLEIYVYTPDTVPNVFHPPPWATPPVGVGATAPPPNVAPDTHAVPALSASVPAGQNLRSALRRGLAVRVRSASARSLTISLTARGRRVGRSVVRVPAGRAETIRVRVELATHATRRASLNVSVGGPTTGRLTFTTVLR
jgi:hypothetical protein